MMVLVFCWVLLVFYIWFDAWIIVGIDVLMIMSFGMCRFVILWLELIIVSVGLLV